MTATMARRTLVVLGILGATATSGPALAPAGEAEGKALYEKQCKTCHSIAGEGGAMAAMGGALDGVGAKRSAAWLRAYLTDPRSQVEGAKMPRLPLGGEALDDVITFLATLKTPAAE